MPSPIMTDTTRTGGFMVREAPGYLSRDGASITNTGTVDMLLPPGLVLALAAPTAATSAPLGTNTGTGGIGTITASPGAQPGAYVVNLVSPSAFTVENPDGVEIGHGTVGTPITAGFLTFVVSAGDVAFLAGDGLTITAPPSIGSYTPFTGSGVAAAILYGDTAIPAGGTRKVTVIVRNAEVNGPELSWDPAITGAANVAQLQASAAASLGTAGLILRTVAPSAG